MSKTGFLFLCKSLYFCFLEKQNHSKSKDNSQTLMLRNYTQTAAIIILYMLLQVLLFNSWYMALFNYGFCYVYVAIMLLLPIETSTIALLLIGFACGFVEDNFKNSLGIHAAASVLMAYLRPFIIKILTPQRGYEERIVISLKAMGFQWFVSYIGILIVIHHSIVFFMEASSLSLFFPSLLKIIVSSIYTGFVIYIIQYFRK